MFDKIIEEHNEGMWVFLLFLLLQYSHTFNNTAVTEGIVNLVGIFL